MSITENELKIEATDLEVGIRTSYVTEGISDGGVTVNARALFEVVREIPDGISIHFIKKENDWLEILAGRSDFNLMGLSVEDFPEVPVFEGENQWTFENEALKEVIDKTIFSVSSEDIRYNLSGVYMEKITKNAENMMRMVATDGHRLSMIDTKFEGEFPLGEGEGIILPRKGLSELRKVLDDAEDPIGMRLEEKNIIARKENFNLIMRLIDGRFPDYKQVIPESNDKIVKSSREELIRAVRRVSVLSHDHIRLVKFHIKPGIIEITSDNPELGTAKEELPVEYDGPEIEIGFNANYILDILSVMNDEEIMIKLMDESSPGEIRPMEEKDYFFIIMPMKF